MYFKPRIFISSTMGDKIQLRSEIKEIFQSLGAEVALYEKDLTPSVNDNTYRNDILQTDFVIFVIDERYGAKTENGISGTEEEFNIVSINQIPCHVYLKEIMKTTEAENFENLIKLKGISFYYYKNDVELIEKIKSTTFTIARDIVTNSLLKQNLDLKLVTKLARKFDYENGLFYCKLFERLIEICNNSSFDFCNSNLLLTFEFLYQRYLSNKSVFIDNSIDYKLRLLFESIKELANYISTNSVPACNYTTFELPYLGSISVCFNSFNQGYDNNWLISKSAEILSNYYTFKDYLSLVKTESDLL